VIGRYAITEALSCAGAYDSAYDADSSFDMQGICVPVRTCPALGTSRPDTAKELEEARSIVRKWIETFAATL
jgi:hypothetical protein